MAEITPAGYLLKSQNDWFSDEVDLYKAIDPDWILDPSTPDGLKAAHDAEIFSALDEALQRAYNSKDPEKAIGQELDNISAISGVQRKNGTRSDVTLRITGNVGATVLSGAIVESTTTGIQWTIEQTYTVQLTGYVDVQAFAPDIGPVSAETGTITRLRTVMAGIVSATNLAPANLGLDPQSDSSLRIQRRLMVGKPSNNQLDSMYAELMATEDVRRVAVYNNPTGSASVNPELNPYGLPAHSIAVVVDGGLDSDVAMSMYLKLNPGTGMAQVGQPVSVPVPSPIRPSNIQTVKFSRPNAKIISMVVDIVGDGLPDDAAQQVKDAIMDFAVGSLLDPSIGFRSTGFGIGDDVIYSAMFTPVNKIIGQYGNSYVSQIILNGASSNVVVNYNELSMWSESNITVHIS